MVVVLAALSVLVMQSDGSPVMLEPATEIVEAPQLPPRAYLYATYPQVAARLDRIIWCESGWDAAAWNPRSRASGLTQMLPSTWAGTPQGRRGESVWNPYSNLDGAYWLITQGGGWSHWVCR